MTQCKMAPAVGVPLTSPHMPQGQAQVLFLYLYLYLYWILCDRPQIGPTQRGLKIGHNLPCPIHVLWSLEPRVDDCSNCSFEVHTTLYGSWPIDLVCKSKLPTFLIYM